MEIKYYICDRCGLHTPENVQKPDGWTNLGFDTINGILTSDEAMIRIYNPYPKKRLLCPGCSAIFIDGFTWKNNNA